VRGVLLVDDEPLVRRGLAGKIDWQRYGLAVVAEAENGNQALEKIALPEVNLVITDIKMPGTSGLELIRRASELRPELRFVVLSGYDEFDFAKEAMRYGVRHYLLKPTKPSELDRVLREAVQELDEQAEERAVQKEIAERLHKSLPMIREQFFRDLLMGRLYNNEELSSYLAFFGIADEPVGLVLFVLPEPSNYESILTLRWTVERAMGDSAFLFTAIVKDRLALVVPAGSVTLLLERLDSVRKRFRRLTGLPMTVAVGGTGRIASLSALYERANTYLSYRFHYGDDSLITSDDVVAEARRDRGGDMEYNKDRVAVAVQCGDEAEFRRSIDVLMQELRDRRTPPRDVNSHMVELLLAVARGDGYENLPGYLECMKHIQRATTIDEVQRLVCDCCVPVLRANYAELRSKRSLLVEKVRRAVADNLGNSELSLKWLAANLVYANVDYLSKAFKKETNENFNRFVTRLRMEKARELLMAGPFPVAEIARRVGFGDNAQYFSRVFRSQTGLTPTEFRKTGTPDAE
jgi:two-component system response regulator YesN